MSTGESHDQGGESRDASPQTQVVLQQAWKEGIKLCLVINKVDRLILGLQMTPTEAYYHLQQVLEQVSDIGSTHFHVRGRMLHPLPAKHCTCRSML